MESKKLKVSEIHPYEKNPRKNDEAVEAVMESIKQCGYIAPIIVDENYEILAGHTRLKAVKKLGWEEVECMIIRGLTEEQKKKYRLLDNKTNELAEWDFDLLKDELEGLEFGNLDLDWNLPLELTTEEVEDDDFDLTTALEKASFVQGGDRWIVGRHVLYCGDATNAEDVNKLMDGKVANLVLTDPPYNVSFKSSSGLSIKNDSMGNDQFYKFLKSAFDNMVAHCEKGASGYVFHADIEGLNFRKAFIDAGFHLAGCCIWKKDSLVLGRRDYQWQHEPVLYGFLNNGTHHWYSDRKQTTIWEFAKPKRNENHPTSKPLDLLSYPIQNSTRENAIVIDTFGGSGSTLMACERSNRICYTMELDEKYASVILRRYVEDGGDPTEVYCYRNGKRVNYLDVVKEIER